MKEQIIISPWLIDDAINSAWPNANFISENYSNLKEKISNTIQNQK